MVPLRTPLRNGQTVEVITAKGATPNPSWANFVQVRCVDAQALFEALIGQGIVVRDLRALPGLSDALRITLGTPEQNQRVLATIAALALPEGAAA